jgi:hypothetical protein
LPVTFSTTAADVTFIPTAILDPVVVVPLIPALILSAVVLPIILFVIVIDAAAPLTLIPKTPPPIAAVFPELKPPNILPE